MTGVDSYKDFFDRIRDLKKAYLLIYKKGAEQSDCAFRNLSASLERHPEVSVFTADTNLVRDIHSQYGVTTAPSLLVFEKGLVKNILKGCHHPGFFDAIFDNAFVVRASDPGKPSKSVTVYTTPTCTWCNTLKIYLRRNGIRFTEIDVSADQSAAEELIRRSGRQGVPQTDIGGEIIVGFDKGRIDNLLDIQESG
jgi:glutaredoxin-like YruB-family protein